MKCPESRSLCPIGKTLDQIGDRWSLLIVRNLLFVGGQTFTELAGSPEKIATNILADRLVRLEEAGILHKQSDPYDGRRHRYSLTEKGVDLMPILQEMIDWGMKYHPEAWYPEERVHWAEDHKQEILAQARQYSGE
jgi:DNA-binding HxlR family transcriptional regulator